MSHLYVQLEQLEVKSNLRSKGCVVISHLCVQVEQLKVKYNYRSKGFHVMSHLCVQVEQLEVKRDLMRGQRDVMSCHTSVSR